MIERIPIAIPQRCLAVAVVVLITALAGCSSGSDADDVRVTMPGKFEITFPSGWSVILPTPSEDDKRPLFTAGPAGTEDRILAAVLRGEGSDLRSFGEEWQDTLRIKTGDLESVPIPKGEMLVASGSGMDLGIDEEQYTVLGFVRHSSAPNEIWVVTCFEVDKKSDRCDEIVRAFRLVDPL